MTETNHSQTIPVSPNVFPTKNKKMIEQPHYKLDVDKIKTIKDIKNVFELLDLGFYLPEDHKDYNLFKELTIQPEEPRKSLEEIKQELDKKFEEIIEQYKRNSYAHKLTAERKYEDKFDKISYNFQCAVNNGVFPRYLSLTTSGNSLFTVNGGGLSVNNAIISNVNTHNIVINSNVNNVGYWESKPIFKVYFNKRPNWLSRICAKIIFDITWKSV
jgi:hypothetical protein